jgi:hypothetical protein
MQLAQGVGSVETTGWCRRLRTGLPGTRAKNPMRDDGSDVGYSPAKRAQDSGRVAFLECHHLLQRANVLLRLAPIFASTIRGFFEIDRLAQPLKSTPKAEGFRPQITIDLPLNDNPPVWVSQVGNSAQGHQTRSKPIHELFLQLPDGVRKPLKNGKSLIGQTAIPEPHIPIWPQLFRDFSNCVLPKGSRGPIFHRAVLHCPNNINAAEGSPAHGLNLGPKGLTTQLLARCFERGPPVKVRLQLAV